MGADKAGKEFLDPEPCGRDLDHTGPGIISEEICYPEPDEDLPSSDLVVFDPELEWVAGRFESRSQNSPWLGKSLRGRVVATVYGGRVTHRIAT